MARLLIRAVPALAAALAAGAALAATPAAAADPVHGRVVFSQMCSVCHSNTRGGPAMIGPPLFGVVGRKAGGVGGYAYSPALKGSGITWTGPELHTYLQGPAKMIPGVRMPFAGVKNPTQLDDLVAYLNTLK